MLADSSMAREMPHRSLALLALGALAGLVIAGYALFTAPGSTTDKIPQGAIALVNHRQILLSDYRNQLQGLYGVAVEKATPAQRKAVLESMVSEELLVQRGLEIDLPATDPGVREALVSGVELASAADIDARKPAEAELRAWFAAHRDKYTSNGSMLLHDLVVAAGNGRSAEQASGIAESAARSLRQGMTLKDAIVRFGLREARKPGVEEQVDIAVARTLGDGLFAVADRLAAGQVSDPVAARDGVHVLFMERRHREERREFEAVRDQVASDLQRDAVRRAHAEYVQFLRGRAEVLLAPGYGE
ncbi:MAG: peptidylprolyl isomerase [Pseudomonadota bacterium]|nr:peptidylprolyl isomerase [Pseudomonadota bacterium]